MDLRRDLICSIVVLGLTWLLVLVVVGAPAHATPAKEASWLPEAAAYRLTLHHANLEPVPWPAIARAWEEPHRGSEFPTGAFDRIAGKSANDTDALRNAIRSENREALFSAATHLVAMRIEEEFDRALDAEAAAEARRAVAEARELYRAFADHLAAADPKGARALGRAWLELASATGSVGVLGAGAVPPDTTRMAETRRTISAYLSENYLVESFAPRRVLSAIPETVARTGRAVNLPATLPPGSDIFDQSPLPASF